jgi:hypothetical protein
MRPILCWSNIKIIKPGTFNGTLWKIKPSGPGLDSSLIITKIGLCDVDSGIVKTRVKQTVVPDVPTGEYDIDIFFDDDADTWVSEQGEWILPPQLEPTAAMLDLEDSIATEFDLKCHPHMPLIAAQIHFSDNKNDPPYNVLPVIDQMVRRMEKYIETKNIGLLVFFGSSPTPLLHRYMALSSEPKPWTRLDISYTTTDQPNEVWSEGISHYIASKFNSMLSKLPQSEQELTRKKDILVIDYTNTGGSLPHIISDVNKGRTLQGLTGDMHLALICRPSKEEYKHIPSEYRERGHLLQLDASEADLFGPHFEQPTITHISNIFSQELLKACCGRTRPKVAAHHYKEYPKADIDKATRNKFQATLFPQPGPAHQADEEQYSRIRMCLRNEDQVKPPRTTPSA